MHPKEKFVSLLILMALLMGPVLAACAPVPPEPPDVQFERPLPPIVVAITPDRTEELRPDAPILVRFDQPMDPETTAKAFRIEPPVPGRTQVEGNLLIFQPSPAFARATAYRVFIDETARSQDAVPLNAPISFRVLTTGYLAVSSTQPADGTQDVGSDAVITIVFNRPVVPLVPVGEQSDLPQPLHLDPPVEGEGRWLNTSVYQFKPALPLAAATQYQATISGELQDVAGVSMDGAYVWTFHTTDPAVVAFAPQGLMVAPDASVEITFSQPMDQVSAEAAVVVTQAADGVKVAGEFSWSEDGRTLTFAPATNWEFGARYRITIDQSARPRSGEGGLRASEDWTFRVVPLPAVVRTNIPQDSRTVDVGRVVEIYFSAPLDIKTLDQRVHIEPKPRDLFWYFNEYENVLWINFPQEPRTTYTVTVDAEVGDRYSNRLDEDFILRFTTTDHRPSLVLQVPGQVGSYSAFTDTVVSVLHRNIAELELSLYRLSVEDMLKLTGREGWEYGSRFTPDASTLIRRWRVEPDTERNIYGRTPITLLDADNGSLPPGLYYLDARSTQLNREFGESDQTAILIRSNLNLTLKDSTRGALVWATDQRTGQPVANLDVTLLEDSGEEWSNGQTDADGVFTAEFTRPETWPPLYAITGEPGEANFSLVSSRFNTGIAPWDFGFGGGWNPKVRMYLHTDRPIYRAGQKVYWKGFARAEDDARYDLLPTGRPVEIVVRDPLGNQIYKQQHELNEFGGFDGELDLDAAATLGYYSLQAMIGDDAWSIGFQVAAYRRPEFQVTVSTDREEYIHGDKIQLTADAQFFFAAPVQNGKVRWSVSQQPYRFQWRDAPADRWWEYADQDPMRTQDRSSFGRVIAQGEGITDRNGRFSVNVPADLSTEVNSQTFTLEVAVTDESGQEIAGRTTAVIHRAAMYLGISPQSNVTQAGRLDRGLVAAVDAFTQQPLRNVELSLTAHEIEWFSVQEQADDGRYYWTSKAELTAVFTTTLRTDRKGLAEYAWRPARAGSYLLRVSGEDARSNQVRAATYSWVSGEEYVAWRQENNDRIQLVADKRSYLPGDVARILIPSPYQGAVEALLTVERGGILQYQRITLASSAETIELPITEEFIPNVFVSVVLVKGVDETQLHPDFKIGYVELPVDIESKVLHVSITPSAETTAPRDEVVYDIAARDSGGRPVEGEFSLALVDKAILTLATDPAGSIANTFYSRRLLGVNNATLLSISLEPRNPLVSDAPKGGGGGGPGEAELDVDIRRDFPETAYWRGVIRTDAAGRAQVTVRLPDALTTWRMTARGMTKDTRVGENYVEIVTTQDLLIRPVLPRFFTAADEAVISAIVQNNTHQDEAVAVRLVSDQLEIAGGGATQRVTAPAFGTVKVDWPVRVASGNGEAVVRMTVQGERHSDGVELTLPVRRYSTPETVGTAGEIASDEPRVEVIRLPGVLDPEQGELTVRLEPSLAAGTEEGLQYLEHFPYECTEQTVSRFLPNVFTLSALRRLGLENPELAGRLPSLVNVALQRLYAQQNGDGGWGWWTGDRSQPMLTAYVVLGMHGAMNAGFAVDANVMARATDYLRQQLRAPSRIQESAKLNEQAFVLYVLSKMGQGDLSRVNTLYEERERLHKYAQVFLALSLENLQAEGAAAERVETLVGDLQRSAVLTATGAHWEEASLDRYNMNTDIRTTAIVLGALARLRPDDPLLPMAVRWLMVSRTSGRWESTQDTVWSIIGLTEWMLASGELTANYRYQVALNGAEWTSGQVSAENLREAVELRTAVNNLLRDEANVLLLQREGPSGRLYYTAHLEYFVPVEQVTARDRGVFVARSYALADRPDTPITRARVGDVIDVTLTLIAPNDLHYLVVESPLPAGAEGVDVSLLTTRMLYESPAFEEETAEDEQAYWWDRWVPTHSEVRDDRVSLFATYLPRGTYQYKYQIRASLPGRFQVLPATAQEFYFPEVWGRTEGSEFVIEP